MSRKRAQEYGPNYITAYKEHVGLLAAILLAGPGVNPRVTVAEVVEDAMQIINEVDKAVDAELEQTGHESGVR